MVSRFQSRTHSLVFLLIILGFIGVANYFGQKIFYRVDLTEDKIYTLSDSTKKVLSDLDDVISIKAYMSKDLPVPYNKLAQDLQDTLQEYEVYGKGKIELEISDPSMDPELAQSLEQRGVRKQIFPVRGVNDQGFLERYNSVVVQYLDKVEVFNEAAQMQDLEYSLTMTLSKLTRDKQIKVAFFPGPPPQSQDPFGMLRSEIGKRYEVSSEPITDGGYLATDLDVLIVTGPDPLSSRQKYEIDQFVMRGGRVLFMLDGALAVLQYWMAFPSQDNADDLVLHYGVERRHDLVMDIENFGLPFMGVLRQDYPLWVSVYPQELNATGILDHPIVNKLDAVQLPYVSSVASILAGDSAGASVKAISLLKSSPKSWAQLGGQNQFQIHPQQPLPPPMPMAGMEEGSRDLAILLEGEFGSFFKDKPIPPPEPGEEGLEKPLFPENEQDRPQRLDRSAVDTSILVIGCSRFVQDPYFENQLIQSREANLNFVLNTIDWMTLGGDLIGVRARGTSLRPLKSEISRTEALIVGLVGPFLVPVLMIVIGISRSVLRKRAKKNYAEAQRS